MLELLAGLQPQSWTAATVCPGWAVRDVVAHLVHDDLRRLSRTRDGYRGRPAPRAGEALASFLDRINQRWVTEVAFLSPAVIVDLLACTGPLLHAMWAAADVDTLGEGVSWAGVDPAPVWLDLAREYTESWTHQQQIRNAIDRPGLTEPAFLDPVLDTFLRALPTTYADVPAAHGTVLTVSVDDDRLTWSLQSTPAGWTLSSGQRAGTGRTHHDARRHALAAGHRRHHRRDRRAAHAHLRQPPARPAGPRHRLRHQIGHGQETSRSTTGERDATPCRRRNVNWDEVGRRCGGLMVSEVHGALCLLGSVRDRRRPAR